MSEITLESFQFDLSCVMKKWSIIRKNQYNPSDYIIFKEWKLGKYTGRQLLCQVRSCVSVYEAGLEVGDFYEVGKIPMTLPEFYVIEFVPMLTDKRTVLELKSTLESIEDLEAAHRYIFG